MRTPIGIWCGRFALVAIASLLAAKSLLVAQDETEPDSPQAITVSKAEIPVDHLQVILRPLTKDELEIELRGWLDRLSAKIREVGETELKLMALAEDESGDELKEQMLALRTEETAIAERARTVLDALKAKGGDVQTAEQFINAVSYISETTDATSYRAAVVAEVTNWAKRDDGGRLWVKRVLVALIVLFIFWVISKFAGRITAKA